MLVSGKWIMTPVSYDFAECQMFRVVDKISRYAEIIAMHRYQPNISKNM